MNTFSYHRESKGFHRAPSRTPKRKRDKEPVESKEHPKYVYVTCPDIPSEKGLLRRCVRDFFDDMQPTLKALDLCKFKLVKLPWSSFTIETDKDRVQESLDSVRRAIPPMGILKYFGTKVSGTRWKRWATKRNAGSTTRIPLEAPM